MRDHEAPDRTPDSQGDFIAETIACAPLSGAHLQADTRKVNQLLKNYLVSDTSDSGSEVSISAQMAGKTLMPSATITVVKEMSASTLQRKIAP